MKTLSLSHLESGKLYLFRSKIMYDNKFVGMYIDHHICFDGHKEINCYNVLFRLKTREIYADSWEVKKLI